MTTYIINFGNHIDFETRQTIDSLTNDRNSCEIVDMLFYADTNIPIRPQIERLVSKAISHYIDLIRLPPDPVAAVMIIEEFRVRGHVPNVLRIVGAGLASNPKFQACEIIEVSQ